MNTEIMSMMTLLVRTTVSQGLYIAHKKPETQWCSHTNEIILPIGSEQNCKKKNFIIAHK